MPLLIIVVELPVVLKLNILCSRGICRASYMTFCSHIITRDPVPDHSVRQAFMCVNQSFILGDAVPKMGVLIRADITRSGSSYIRIIGLMSINVFFLHEELCQMHFDSDISCYFLLLGGNEMKYKGDILFTRLCALDFFFFIIKLPIATVLVLSNFRPSLISYREHLTRTTTSLLLCGG